MKVLLYIVQCCVGSCVRYHRTCELTLIQNNRQFSLLLFAGEGTDGVPNSYNAHITWDNGDENHYHIRQ